MKLCPKLKLYSGAQRGKNGYDLRIRIITMLVLIGTCAKSQPVITALSSYAGHPGTTINITGTGFNTTADSNEVWFGGGKANITSGSDTSLTVTIPVGATFFPVSVNNKANLLTGYSAKSFLPTFDNSQYVADTINLVESHKLPGGNRFSPDNVEIIDIDGDGKPELVARKRKSVYIFRNIGSAGQINDATFAPSHEFFFHDQASENSALTDLKIQDINGDNKPDLVACFSKTKYYSLGIGLVSVLLNTSVTGTIDNSSFAPYMHYYVSRFPMRLAIADFDGDGRPDIATMGTVYYLGVSILRNTIVNGMLTAGSFATRIDKKFPTSALIEGTVPISDMATGDIDGDGKQDIVVKRGLALSLTVLRNVCTPGVIDFESFSDGVDIASPYETATQMVLADVDGDGKLDMVSSDNSKSKIDIWKNISTPGTIEPTSFFKAGTYPVNGKPDYLRVGDLNGDGKPDVAVTCSSDTEGASICILRNGSTTGSIDSTSFAPYIQYYNESISNKIAIGDMDGDGIPDLALSNGNRTFGAPNYITLYRNKPIFQTPIVGPSSMCDGGDTTTFSIALTGGTWSSSDTGVATIDTLTGLTTSASAGVTIITYTYDTTVTTTALIVHPSASTIAGGSEYCIGVGGVLSNLAPNGIWSSADTSVAAVDSFGNIAAMSAGTTQISYATSCGTAAVKNITVNPFPDAIAGSTSIDVGDTSTLSNSTGGGIWSSVDTSIVVINPTTGFAFGKRASSCAITYEVNGCSVSATVTVNASSLPAPTITAVSTVAEEPGESISLTGTNFNTATSGNVVYFGATRGTVNSASSTMLNVTVPAWSTDEHISVNNTESALTGYTKPRFSPSFDYTNYLPDINFVSEYKMYSFRRGGDDATIADIDGDGKFDIIDVDVSSENIVVSRNNIMDGALTASSLEQGVYFQSTAPSSVNHSSYTAHVLATGDIDGDGHPDIVSVNPAPKTFSVFRNTAVPGIIDSSSLAPAVEFDVSASEPSSIALCDFDLDGKLDVVIVNNASNTVSVFHNTSTSGFIDSNSFGARVDFATGTRPVAVATGDIDGDGKPDIIVTNHVGYASVGTISILRNTTTPDTINSSSFAAKVDFSAGLQPFFPAIGDIDGDGKPDICVFNNEASYFSLFRNTATPGSITSGSLSSRVAITVSSANTTQGYGQLVDVTGDGKPEVVFTMLNSGEYAKVYVCKNTATPGTINSSSFAAKVQVANSLYRFFVGDIDGDHKPDIIDPGYATYLRVIKNNPLAISKPTSICVGQTQTLHHVQTGGYWSSSDPSIATIGTASGVVTGVSAGSATIIYAIPGGGYDSTTVTVFAIPTPITGPATSCTGDLVLFTNDAKGGEWDILNFTGLGLIDSSGYVISQRSGVARISYTIGCATPVIKNVTFNPVPDWIEGPDSLYPGTYTTLTNTVAGGTWTSSDTSIATINSSGVISAMTEGNTIITYSLSTGCKVMKRIKVYPDIFPPIVTSVTPAIAIPGDTVTISGSNFATTTDSNVAYFGPVRATLLSASSTSLSAIVPVSSTFNHVSVTRPGTGRTGHYISHFLPTFDSNIYRTETVNLEPKVNFPAVDKTTSVATGDLDGDGKPDVVALSWFNRVISIYRNVSDSGVIDSTSLTEKYEIGVEAEYARYLVLADFDGDGKQDILVSARSGYHTSYEGGDFIFIYRNISVPGVLDSNSFAAPVRLHSVYSVSSFAVADLDMDGKPDIIAPRPSPYFSFWRNTSTPGVIKANLLDVLDDVSITSAGPSTKEVVIGDLDGDGLSDFVASLGNKIALYRNTSQRGLFSFVGPIYIDFGLNDYGDIAMGDLDGDGKQDLVTLSTSTTNRVFSILRNTATPGEISGSSFAAKVDFPSTYWNLYGVDIADMNGDAKPDIVITSEYSERIGVFTNTSTPGTIDTSSFSMAASINLMEKVTEITLTDIDGDKITDIVAAGKETESVIILRNHPLFAFTDIWGPSEICLGTTASYTHDTAGGIWSCSNDTIATISSSGIVTTHSSGTAFITYSTPNDTATKLISVVTFPDLDTITGPSKVYVDSSITLANTESGGVWQSSDTTILVVDESGHATGISYGTATIKYVYENACGVDSTEKVIDVDTLIDFEVTGSLLLCSEASTTLVASPSGGAWSCTDTTIATIDAATGVVVAQSSGTATIYYSIGDQMTSVSITVSEPVTITGAGTLCTGQSENYVGLPTGGAWTNSDTTYATISPTGLATGMDVGTAIITYTLPNGCSATTTITVNQLPDAIVGVQEVCIDATTALSNMATGGLWSSADTATVTIDATGVATGIATGTTTITYALPDGCYTTTTITVNALPESITGTLEVCEESETTLISTTGGGTWTSDNTTIATISSTGLASGVNAGTANISYSLPTGCSVTTVLTVKQLPEVITGTLQICEESTTTLTNTITGGTWSSGSTAIASIIGTGIATGVAAGTTIITYTLPEGCYTTTTLTVNVLPETITGVFEVCEGSTITLANVTSGGTWASDNITVATISSAGLVSGTNAGTTNITYMLPAGCYTSVTVTVNQQPEAISGTLQVCEGATTTLSNSITGGTWSSSSIANATITGTGIATGSATGTTTITYALPDGCYTTATLTVNEMPEDITGTFDVCEGSTISLTNTTSGGAWTSENTTVATINGIGLASGINAGTANITYMLPAGCYTSATVTVNQQPEAINGVLHVCEGATTSLSNSITGGTWSSSSTVNATITGTGVATGVTAGTTTITYALPDGCRTTATLTVNEQPEDITGTLEVCEGSSTTLSSATPGGSWSSADVSIATVSTAGEVTGFAANTASIIYTLPDGCSTSTSVTVNPLPEPITGDSTICKGATETLHNSTPGGVWSSSIHLIADVDTSGTVLGINAGISRITYALTTGCFVSKLVTVNPALPTIVGPETVCVGTNTPFTNATVGGTWSSETSIIASIDESGILNAITPGITTISYTLPTGCYATKVITVNPAISTIMGPETVCEGTAATFTNATVGGTWTSESSTVAAIDEFGILNGIAAGTNTISYTLPTGCYATKLVTINALPPAIDGSLEVCEEATVSLHNAVAGGSWSSSDISVAAIAPDGLVDGIISGTATITYTLPTGCSTTGIVTIHPLPSPLTGVMAICEEEETIVNATPSGGTWTTSNPTITQVDTTGSVTGLSAGTSNISYTLPTGCFVTSTTTVNENPAVISGNRQVCEGLTTTLLDTITGGSWHSDNTAVADIDSDGILTGNNAGTAIIYYVLPTGCTTNAIVTVNFLPSTITGPEDVCEGLTVSLSNLSTGGLWSIADTTTASIDTEGIVTGVNAGSTIVTYTLPTGCITTTTIITRQTPATITGNTAICSGFNDTLYNAITGGIWTSLNASIASIGSTGIVTGIAPGTTTIEYASSFGCITSVQITVNPVPDAISGDLEICKSSTSLLSTASTGGSWSSSNTTVANVDAVGLASATAQGTASISYTLPTGCLTSSTVTVNALPAAISGIPEACKNASTPLSNATVGGTWTTGDLSIATISSGGMVTGASAGTTYVTYTLPTSCLTTSIVTIHPLPQIDTLLGGGGYCAGGTGVALSLGNSVSGNTYTLYHAPSTPLSFAGSGLPLDLGMHTEAGDYYVLAQNPPGCVSTMHDTATITIIPIANPHVNISTTPMGSICDGTSVDFTANHIDAGLEPGIEWMVNGTSVDTGSIFTYIPSDNDVVTVVLTSSATCVTAPTTTDSVNMSVITNELPTVSTVVSDDSVCQYTPVTFWGSALHGGTSPIYTWFVNNNPVATGSDYTYIPADGDNVFAELHSSYPCLVANDIKSETTYLKVDSVKIPNVDIDYSPVHISHPGQPISFTAHIKYGGSSLEYQWLKNGVTISGATSMYYTDSNLRDNDSITCFVENTDLCRFTSFNSIIVHIASDFVQLSPKTSSIKLLPNPNSGNFSVVGSFASTSDSFAQISILNMLGQEVLQTNSLIAEGQINKRIVLDNGLSSGMYTLVVQLSTERYVLHFVLRK